VALMRQLAEDKQRVEHDLAEYQRQQLDLESHMRSLQALERWCQAMGEQAETLSYLERRTVLYSLRVRVAIYPTDVASRAIMTVRDGKPVPRTFPVAATDCVQNHSRYRAS
jgi:hypothetical protein